MDFKLKTAILLVLLSGLTLTSVQAQEDATPTIEATETAATETVEPTPSPSIEATASVEATVSAETPTPTLTPTDEATQSPTSEPTATPDYSGDLFEPDSPDAPQMYTGHVRRTFNPIDDVDYIALRIKPGVTILETSSLTGAADTRLTVYKKGTTAIMGSDDDSGEGLASRVVLNAGSEFEILVVIENRSMGYGAEVGYDFQVTQQAEFTLTPTAAATRTPYPTYTPFPTWTATAQPTATPAATWTPLPTYTPYPTRRPATIQATQRPWPTQTSIPTVQWPTKTAASNLWPTRTPIPTATATMTPSPPTATPNWMATNEARRIAWEETNVATVATQTAQTWSTATPRPPLQAPISVSNAPVQATETPAANRYLRVEVFIDMDADSLLDAGEGMQNVFVNVTDLLNQFQYSGYTDAGVLFVPIWSDTVLSTLQVAVPYLSETRQLSAESDDATDEDPAATQTIQFAITAPLLPIALP